MIRVRSATVASSAVAGACVTGSVVVAAQGHMPSGDVTVLLSWAIGGAALAGVMAAAVLRSMRGAGVRAQTVVASLAPVVAVAVGVAGASSAMFIDLFELSRIHAGALDSERERVALDELP